MNRLCKKCGGEITDLSIHRAAKLCPECRAYAMNTHKLDADRYGPAFRAYLDEHGWPTYVTASKLLDLYPDLLADQGFKTDSRRRQVVGVCIRAIPDAQGRRYTPYNKLQFRLTDPTPQEATA